MSNRMKRTDLLKTIAALPLIAPTLSLIPKTGTALGGMWEGIAQWRYVGNGAAWSRWFSGPPEQDDLWVARLKGWHIEYMRPGWLESVVHHVGPR
jgi:hypothetical protein